MIFLGDDVFGKKKRLKMTNCRACKKRVMEAHSCFTGIVCSSYVESTISL